MKPVIFRPSAVADVGDAYVVGDGARGTSLLELLLGGNADRCYVDSIDLALTAVFRKVPEGYIGFVEELPGANTQGDTLEEARTNLNEAVALVLDANRAWCARWLQGARNVRSTAESRLGGFPPIPSSAATCSAYMSDIY